ncbi:MAG TPA: hypothetical protein VI248_25015 [Kineosporiaceae bacterium]
MADSDQEKHETRKEAHEAGIEGASKLTPDDARQAVQEVEHGADPQEAKASATSD